MNPLLYKLAHYVYKLTGHIVCRFYMSYWALRDKISPPKEKAILFVAHPDDDTLFFHTFIKKHKPYVVLMTTGWSLRRFPDFRKAMRWYGVRYRAFDMETNDTRIDLLNKRIKYILDSGCFEKVVTHNSTGEYGHEMHKKVHDAVCEVSNIRPFCPVSAKEITNYPLEDKIISEKREIFKIIYTTESWVLDEDIDWVENEKLIAL